MVEGSGFKVGAVPAAMRIPLAFDAVQIEVCFLGTSQSPDRLRSLLSISLKPIAAYLYSWAEYSACALRTGSVILRFNS